MCVGIHGSGPSCLYLNRLFVRIDAGRSMLCMKQNRLRGPHLDMLLSLLLRRNCLVATRVGRFLFLRGEYKVWVIVSLCL